MMSESKKFIFIHIPKTAGNAITTALKKYSNDEINLRRFDGENYHGISLWNRRKEIRKHSLLVDYEKYYDLNKYFKFVSVRNPWDKLLSWYFYHKKTNQIKDFDDFLNMVFVKGKIPKNSKDDISWYGTQLSYLKNKKGEIIVDQVIKFENLQDDFNVVCEKIGIKKNNLLHLNKSENSQIDYKNYYTEKQRDFVGNIYLEDIEYFNYSF